MNMTVPDEKKRRRGPRALWTEDTPTKQLAEMTPAATKTHARKMEVWSRVLHVANGIILAGYDE